ncbi:MAG: 50S ribosomal protein L29 [Candidatus Woesearchaeota archaeon]|jgi:large subunit ribosomal protein L29|nr:50S ribosomal protein L29 [Candidatus Woesearchaeota archaeon]MDP7324334.1 50S ribosomal protein L29 [Candidatus Woesearchaeota archaeon]MDP7457946.1 50S ribosomal protein L29 [Candidatus Woesearchaeota archaeon]
MKHKELVGQNVTELQTKLEELRKELIKNNTQIAAGTTPKSPGQVREIKKTISRIFTILKSKGTKEVKQKDARD